MEKDSYRKPKILIVDDTPANQDLFRQAFEMAGFQVLVSGEAEGNFAEAVAQFSPDIISMDIMIGESKWGEEGRDGFDAIRLLKENPESAKVPIIVMTNFFEDSKVELAKELGVVDYVNLQSHSIQKIPEIFLTYLANKDNYIAVHPSFR